MENGSSAYKWMKQTAYIYIHLHSGCPVGSVGDLRASSRSVGLKIGAVTRSGTFPRTTVDSGERPCRGSTKCTHPNQIKLKSMADPHRCEEKNRSDTNSYKSESEQ